MPFQVIVLPYQYLMLSLQLVLLKKYLYKKYILQALEWDEAFKKNTDESGRAVLSIHNDALKEILQEEDKITDESIKVQDHF